MKNLLYKSAFVIAFALTSFSVYGGHAGYHYLVTDDFRNPTTNDSSSLTTDDSATAELELKDTKLKELTNVKLLKKRAETLFLRAQNRKYCIDYNPGVTNTKIESDLIVGKNNPIVNAKNCLLKAVDEAAVPLCKKEIKLLRAEKRYKNWSDLKQINKALIAIEETKEKITNILEEESGKLYHTADQFRTTIGNRRQATSLERSLLIKDINSLARYFDISPRDLCESNLVMNRLLL